MFLMQLLNIFFLLKDLMNRFFNENRTFSNNVASQYILYFIVVTCIICKFLFSFLRICFILGHPYSFWYLVIVSFNFTVYDIIYI